MLYLETERKTASIYRVFQSIVCDISAPICLESPQGRTGVVFVFKRLHLVFGCGFMCTCFACHFHNAHGTTDSRDMNINRSWPSSQIHRCCTCVCVRIFLQGNRRQSTENEPLMGKYLKSPKQKQPQVFQSGLSGNQTRAKSRSEYWTSSRWWHSAHYN